MTTVTATKIRDHAHAPTLRSDPRCVYSGFLVGQPIVGRGLVIFRDPNGHRMVTTPVRRVLSAGDGALYVETENSVYRLTFHELPQARAA